MPRPSFHCRLLAATLFGTLLLSGCFRLTEPGPGSQPLRVQIEKRVLRDAKQAFAQADYAEAILLLNRFIRNHPSSSRSPEARWWLARSYQETGALPSAVEYFRLLANAPTPNFYAAEARLRVAHLENVLVEPTTSGPVRGILVSLESLKQPGDLASVRSANREIDGSMILLDVPCDLDGTMPGNGQPVSPRMLQSAIRHLHSQGMAVYLGVTLRCMGHVAWNQQGTLEHWKDWDYHPESGTLRRSPYYSLSRFGYRAFLVEWLSRLRDLPLAGLVFRYEVFSGLYEGFHPVAVQAFEREFDVDFDPVRVLKDYGPMPETDADAGVQLPAVFWKWAGWKARERLRILRNLVAAVRVHLPHVRFGLEVQLQSVADPLHGLVHFAEDWVDAAHGPFDVLLTTIKATSSPWLPSAPHDSPAGRVKAWSVPVMKLVQYLGRPEKIWIILPRPSLRTPGPLRIFPKGVGRVYDHRVVP